ncbi:MAG TPA: hypothetical protein VNJ53_03440 [Gaiellaceae bacterium]|nr:hypothetical protein [Gaiellaceae bacterium]
MATYGVIGHRDAGGLRPAARGALDARSLALFTAAVALLAIFSDAALGHGLTWENDPYWTYWVTKTFLIATVFGLGTAWLGVGPGRGAVVTAVHTLVLTVYYWTLSPIGLPSHPEWLDLEHTWLTGLPIHFGVIYLGYLGALFVWRRGGATPELPAAELARHALGASLAIVLLGGGLVSVVLWEFPGVTWFVVRLLVTFTFVLLWWALAGRDVLASTVGGIALAFVWATYGHLLGPSGLPDGDLRILAEDPPPATVEWMGYRDLWLLSLPVLLVVASAVLVFWGALLDRVRLTSRELRTAALPVAALLVPLLVAAALVSGDGTDVRLSASGPAQVGVGPLFGGTMEPGEGTFSFTGEDAGARVSPLPPHDQIRLRATVSGPRGAFAVDADQPLVDDPLGRHGTWWGIGLDVWHHGRSGIGSDKVPPTHSDVAFFALGSVRGDGRELASGVPIHAMTSDDGLDLVVGDPDIPVPGLPDGHLHARWPTYEGGADTDLHTAGYATGSIVLALLLVFALGVVARRDARAA